MRFTSCVDAIARRQAKRHLGGLKKCVWILAADADRDAWSAYKWSSVESATEIPSVDSALGKQLLSRDLERFKIDLQHESQAEITRLRAALERKQIEHQESVRWLQVKRGDAIERVHEVYLSALNAVETAETDATLVVDYGLGDIYSPTVTVASNAVDELHEAIRSLETFLPTDLVTSLEVSWQEFSRVMGALRWLEMSLDPAHTMPEHDAEEAAAKIRELVPQRRGDAAQVIEEFRRAIEPRG